MVWQKLKDEQYAKDHPSKRKLAMIALRKVMNKHGFIICTDYTPGSCINMRFDDTRWVEFDDDVTVDKLDTLLDHMD